MAEPAPLAHEYVGELPTAPESNETKGGYCSYRTSPPIGFKELRDVAVTLQESIQSSV